MAQAVFDDHPLEQYFREEAGEASGMMPGGSSEFMLVVEDEDIDGEGENMEMTPGLLNDLYESLNSAFAPQTSTALVERFKYSVISSSLLSTSLSTTQTHRRYSSDIPGDIHSRSSSIDRTEANQPQQPTLTHSLGNSEPHYLISALALALVTVVFSAGYYGFSALIGVSYLYIFMQDSTSKHAMTPSLNALDDLISAGNVWDSVVQDVMTTLEKDEKRMIYGTSIPSPASSLRVALHSTLLTTQNQCDNVRQLLAALASHTELAQLSEMYAPPSPIPNKSTFNPSQGPRPFSLPIRKRSSSSPKSHTTIDNKRATWNGSYASLANAGSPTMQILKRREKRRSDLSALLQSTTSPKSASAPVTPSGDGMGLEGVAEEDSHDDDDDNTAEDQEAEHERQREQFGLAALELQRQRKLGGLETLGVPRTPSTSRHRSLSPNPNYSTVATPGLPLTPSPTRSPLLSPRSPRSPLSPLGLSASRFTNIQAPRHPLSLSALHLALQGALASKRYACSHLLALRFAEEKDDETYWEDVRSVMELLTTTFVDASARLTEALEEVERMRLEDEQPTPAPVGMKLGEEEPGMGVFEQQQRKHRPRSSLGEVSFAPMPSHLSRFATHVEAISSALNDAREHLEECVAKLKEGDPEDSRRSVSPSPGFEGGDEQDRVHPALQAYERLRRELGLALRECERGRERLLDVVQPSRSGQSDDEEEDDLPGLGHDREGSVESDDKPDSMEYESISQSHPHSQPVVVNSDGPSGGIDDATSHLLLTAGAEHLPPPGIEQVYEGDSANVGIFNRERSKLSREERIEMVKKARESGKRLSHLGIRLPEESTLGMEKWGPGGEVVQELKDVIWKVGEKRRRMASDSHIPTDHRPQLLQMSGPG
ncbi:hypothetical protein VNI00_016721 [Paramarasmius palmivorus]|uniref:Myosin-binding domain-containing protein n=1 Tax=Paramarasmius palmivorus TaxID=297713 RepID=A0AAW0BCY2_9AGAR